MTHFAYFCGHEQWQPEEIVEHAVAAEAAGFDMVVTSEHFHPWVDDVGAAGFAFSTLGAVAAATDRVGLATGVTTPLWRSTRPSSPRRLPRSTASRMAVSTSE